MARYEPDSATGRMKAARRHRERAYAERNELIGVLARLWPAHVMPVGQHLRTLIEKAIVCIHSPAGPLAWVITQREADEQFPALKRIADNHWDRSNRLERSERLKQITGLAPKVRSIRTRLTRATARQRKRGT